MCKSISFYNASTYGTKQDKSLEISSLLFELLIKNSVWLWTRHMVFFKGFLIFFVSFNITFDILLNSDVKENPLIKKKYNYFNKFELFFSKSLSIF